MDISQLIGWFGLSVLVAGIVFYRFDSVPKDGFNNWLIGVIACGLCTKFAIEITDFMHLESRLLLALFFLIPHAIGFFGAFLVSRKLA